MVTESDVKRDKALKEAKAEYLDEMRKARAEYSNRRTTIENIYTGIRSHVWKEFWEDVG